MRYCTYVNGKIVSLDKLCCLPELHKYTYNNITEKRQNVELKINLIYVIMEIYLRLNVSFSSS